MFLSLVIDFLFEGIGRPISLAKSPDACGQRGKS